MSVAGLPNFLRDHWPQMKQQLLTGTYMPHPVRRAEIPKAGGGMRKLGIPTVVDRFVQQAVLRLLEDPSLIQEELDRRLEAAKNADPLKQREGQLQRDRARMAKNMDRLLTAYQEDLVGLEQLRDRMPELRKKEQAIQAELRSLETAAADQTKYLRLVETLSDFNTRLRARRMCWMLLNARRCYDCS
jgi:hypothetical protein